MDWLAMFASVFCPLPAASLFLFLSFHRRVCLSQFSFSFSTSHWSSNNIHVNLAWRLTTRAQVIAPGYPLRFQMNIILTGTDSLFPLPYVSLPGSAIFSLSMVNCLRERKVDVWLWQKQGNLAYDNPYAELWKPLTSHKSEAGKVTFIIVYGTRRQGTQCVHWPVLRKILTLNTIYYDDNSLWSRVACLRFTWVEKHFSTAKLVSQAATLERSQQFQREDTHTALSY